MGAVLRLASGYRTQGKQMTNQVQIEWLNTSTGGRVIYPMHSLLAQMIGGAAIRAEIDAKNDGLASVAYRGIRFELVRVGG
jgi:hypothetical protein